MQTTVTVELVSANERPAGRGFMVICDAIVDGKEANVIWWDPTNKEDLRPGATFEIGYDGKDAKWNTHNGKTSFQIRASAAINKLTEGTGTAPAATAYQGAPSASRPAPAPSGPAKSGEEVLDRAAELVAYYAGALEQLRVPQEIIEQAAPLAPTVISSWWFGEGKWA